MLTLGGRGPTQPGGALAGGRAPPPPEEADHGQEEAADDGAEAEPQGAVDQGPLVGAQLQPRGGCKTGEAESGGHFPSSKPCEPHGHPHALWEGRAPAAPCWGPVWLPEKLVPFLAPGRAGVPSGPWGTPLYPRLAARLPDLRAGHLSRWPSVLLSPSL